MASQLEICNMAIVLVGGQRISDITDTEQAEAIVCNDNYETVIYATMEDAEWSFAMTRASLSPDVTSPDFGYEYRFQKPTDCLRVIDASARVDFRDNLEWVVEGNYILTDAEAIYIRYIARISDTTLYSDQFVQAVVLKLAAALAIPIAGSVKLRDKYEEEAAAASAMGANKDGMQGVNTEFKNYQLINAR